MQAFSSTSGPQEETGDNDPAPASDRRLAVLLVLLAVTTGVLLRGVQYFAGTSLWFDELALASNLSERSLGTLLTDPLRYAQVAPPGWLLIEKLMFDLFGPSEHALRLYSFLCGIGALVLLGVVAWQLGQRLTAWLAPGVIAVSGAFIFQSSQVKPYSGDVLWSLGIIAVALALTRNGTRPVKWAMALGAIVPWLSFGAAVVMAGVGGALLLSRERRRLLPVVAVWAVAVLLAVLVSAELLVGESVTDRRAYWRGGALGFPPAGWSALAWLPKQLAVLLWSETGLRGAAVWLAAALAGAAVLWRRDRMAALILTAPIAAAALAAALHRFPLGARVSHAVVALLVLLIATTVGELAARLRPGRSALLALAPALLLFAMPLSALARALPPQRPDDVKPVLRAMAAEMRSDDVLYVYPGAWHAYRFYEHLLPVRPENVVLSGCPRRGMRDAIRHVDAVRGEPRAWVLFSHVVIPEWRQLLLDYLDAIGERRMTFANPDPYVPLSSSVDAHLYDLSDARRLAAVSAETFPVRGGEAPARRQSCMRGMLPMLELAAD